MVVRKNLIVLFNEIEEKISVLPVGAIDSLFELLPINFGEASEVSEIELFLLCFLLFLSNQALF